MPIRRRKFNKKSANNPGRMASTHRLTIGFSTPNVARGGKIPHRLPGFLIRFASLDENKELPIDFASMKRLGATEERITEAMEKELKAPAGILPTKLDIYLLSDAEKTVDGWRYPFMDEQYQCWLDQQKFCFGDGIEAFRLAKDGSYRSLPCLPDGCLPDTPKEQFCNYSVEKKCKAKIDLTIGIMLRTDDGVEPLCPQFRDNARFFLRTTSDDAGGNWREILDQAAERLNGQIAGLPGILVWQLVSQSTGSKGKIKFANVPKLSLYLSELGIREKRDRTIAGLPIFSTPKQLPAPTPHGNGDDDKTTDSSLPDEAQGNPAPSDTRPDDSPEPQYDDVVYTIPVEDSSDEDLVRALESAERQHKGEEGFWETFGVLRFPVLDEDMVESERTFVVPNAQWFLQGATEAKKRFRLNALRETCMKMEREGHLTVEANV